MPETGAIAVFNGIREPFDLREFPVPDPEPGAAVIRMRLANVCGSDMHYWRGDTDLVARGFNLPGTLGHEGTGEIAKLGAGLTVDTAGKPLREGDRVVFGFFHPCMRCANCLKGHTYACPTRQTNRMTLLDEWPYFRGTFADYYYLFPNHSIFRVPDHLSDHHISGVNCALAQVVSGLDRAGQTNNETVAIQGAGGLGVYATAVAQARGAACVIVIDGVPERLELAKAFGADETVDMREFPTPEARVARVQELTGGLGADVTMELVGHPAVFPEGVAMTAPGGRYVEIGNVCVGHTASFDPSTIVFKSITVLGVAHYRWRDLKQALDFVSDNVDKLPFDRVLSHTYPLHEINEAFERQDEGHVTRSALTPTT